MAKKDTPKKEKKKPKIVATTVIFKGSGWAGKK